MSAVLDGGYPGVYVQEVPSGVRTVTGAATSNLAALGHFPRGPVDAAVRVGSWSDVERLFGGLDRRYPATYALQDFYLQGGTIAYVVRVGFQQATATLTTTEPALRIEARDPGVGGNDVRYAVSHNDDGTFDLSVLPTAGADPVVFTRLSATPGTPNFAATRVNAPEAQGGSALVRVSAVRHRPAETGETALADGADQDGDAPAVPATAEPVSEPLPALVLQAVDPGPAGNALTVESTDNGNSAST